ncbi:hypothetical protein EV356DRAFT_512987 [Viridothelium virens]|uniref:Phox-like protein n=1 Tax=Viridothelium virens TaxID=1048519 RepID=A0A6A6HEB0_VIRVR|nr:hypothetical protein EV356DRAFT_512987 [Viridothelium virens]
MDCSTGSTEVDDVKVLRTPSIKTSLPSQTCLTTVRSAIAQRQLLEQLRFLQRKIGTTPLAMSQGPDLTIPTTSLSETSKPYTLYHIHLPHPLRTLVLQKRYSDFLDLHSSLSTQAGTPPPAPLPPKTWFGSTVSSPTLTESRRRGLEIYLQAIATSPDSQWRSTSAWQSFLSLPSNPFSTSLTSSSTVPTTNRPTIRTSAHWLDAHTTLKTQLRDARQAIARREQRETSVAAAHEASAEAKKALVRAGTLIAELERGLRTLQEGDSGEKLAEGEVRRRRDMLSGARKEREALESVLSSTMPRAGGGGGGGGGMGAAAKENGGVSSPGGAVGGVKSSGAATAADKSALLSGAPSQHQQGGAGRGGRRRVLGAAPVPETVQTRELDNEGVLQLQQQIMSQQDEDVVDLAKVVRRMREMGVQINDELDVQKAMLDMVDEDVERVDGKIKIAKKRVGEIK